MPFRPGKRFEKYTIHCVLGRGNEGGVVYRALHEEDTEREPVALKHPVRQEEQKALRALQERAPRCAGVAPLLDWGAHYVVTELLGPSIKTVFEELERQSLDERWEVVRMLGSVLVRSLETIHSCGLVHCDVQPSNILLGRSPEGLARPFFIDFGCARTFPDGDPMQGDWGSLDYNSARSADGGVRGPHDDLESLGWVLCHGLFGDLPWFEWTRTAWESGEWKKRRESVAKRIQRAKFNACEKGWARLGPAWRHFTQIPKQLQEFLQLCCRGEGQPDYDFLSALLRGSRIQSPVQGLSALEEDLRALDAQVASLLPEGHLEDVGMRVKDREPIRAEGFGAPWQRPAAFSLFAATEASAQAEAVAAAAAAAAAARGKDARPPGDASSPRTPRTSFTTFDFSDLEDEAAKAEGVAATGGSWGTAAVG